MKRRFIFICLILCFCVCCNVVVYAEETNSIESYEYGIEEEDAVSVDEIEDTVSSVIDAEKNESIDEEEVYIGVENDEGEDEFDIAKVDLSTSYVEYILNDFLITEYYENKSFADVISGTYRIKVPYVTETGEDAILVLSEQDSSLALVEERILGEEGLGYVSPEDITEIINEEVPGTVVEDVKYTYSERYYMTVVYVKTDKGEYVIPYAKTGQLNVDNGKAYTVNKFFKKLNTLFDEDQLKGSKENGGLPYRENNVGYYMILMVVSMGGILVCVTMLRKKKLINKDIKQ